MDSILSYFMCSCFERRGLFLRVRAPCLSMFLHKSITNDIKKGGTLPLLMTFRSTYQSPKTVKRNANEFVMGTVKLNSAKKSASSQQPRLPDSRRAPILASPSAASAAPSPNVSHNQSFQRKQLHTSLPNQQKEPHAPSQVYHQRHRIPRVLQQIHYPKEGSIQFTLEPASLHGVR